MDGALLISENITESIIACLLFYFLYARLAKWPEVQNVLLLTLGYIVISLLGLTHLLLLLIITGISYWAGLWLGREKSRTLLILAILLFVGVLAYFRYESILVESLAALVTPGAEISIGTLLPLGISFYVLQAISYVVDIYAGRISASKNIIHVALYLSLIFKLPAGPIERPGPFIEQIRGPRGISADQIETGFYLILIGLFEKFVVADNLSPIVSQVFNDPQGNGGINILLGVLAFAFQLYGDFSGYTNIARGAAKLFGFELTVNFKLPYLASSPSDFWQRWHISLSNWLRDYIFFPIRRWLVTRKLNNHLAIAFPPLATMIASGWWHGPTAMFILWGLYWAALLIVFQYLDHPRSNRSKIVEFFGSSFSVALMFGLTCIGWLIFRSQDMANLGSMLGHLSLRANAQTYGFFTDLIFFAGPLILLNLVQAYKQDLLIFLKLPIIVRALGYAGLAIWILVFASPVGAEFIYAQF